MKCPNCEKELGDYPERAVEEDGIDEVIGHKHQPSKSDPSFVASQKEFYCSPDCFYESVVAGDDV
jgi:hypothetical protein